jgi:hypothetical protein
MDVLGKRPRVWALGLLNTAGTLSPPFFSNVHDFHTNPLVTNRFRP